MTSGAQCAQLKVNNFPIVSEVAAIPPSLIHNFGKLCIQHIISYRRKLGCLVFVEVLSNAVIWAKVRYMLMRQMTLRQMTLRQMTLRQMTLRQMTQRQIGQMTVG